MKYLVAGGLGFICSELCRQLLRLKDTERVYIVDDDSKGYGITNIQDLLIAYPDAIEWIKIDLSAPSQEDLWLLQEVVGDVNFVISGAAKIGGIGYFNKIPATILRDNNLINTTLLDLIVELPKENRPRYVCMSSSMVFESATKFPSKESDLASTIIPITSYGMSKLSSEYYCKAYAAQYGLEYTIVRPFNAVGPERPDPNFVGFSHVIPDLICKINLGQGIYSSNPLKLLGDGHQIRHYTDVKDIADGIITCMKSNKSINEDFNISIGQGHEVIEVAHLIWNAIAEREARLYNVWGHGTLYIENERGFDHDVKFRSPDVSKMKDYFGWEAKLTLKETMPYIVDSVLKLLTTKKTKLNFCGTKMDPFEFPKWQNQLR